MPYYMQMDSPIGPLVLESDGEALTGVRMNGSPPEKMIPEAVPVLIQAKDWLEDYFRGHPRKIDFLLAPKGTPFQQTVWQLLLSIPFGATRTYGQLARDVSRLLGKEAMSAQAVGGAVGRNPIAILIPCHRVLGAGGKLTGYAGGLEKKAWLLDHEQRNV